MSRATGENVGSYAISKDSYTYGSNYEETFVGANLAIGTRSITLAADSKSKTYGDTDPVLTAQVTTGTIVTGDIASGTLSRATGENVASYAISKNSYTYGSNYEETFVGAELSIGTRPITIAADAKSKTYGDNDPALTAQVTAGTIVTGDMATGTLSRATGENVGSYAISKDTYTYGSNYEETFVGAELSIGTRPITIAADAKSKTYGDNDPALTAQVTAGTIVTGDMATGTLSRATGENVGAYTINKGTLTYWSNYDESLVNNDLTIVKKVITVTAISDTRAYNGALSSSINPRVETLASGDGIDRQAIQIYDNPNVGISHVLTASGLTIKNGIDDATGNYTINYVTSPATGIITAKQLTVTDPTITSSKVYDGNNTASVIEGFLSDVAPGDVGNVSISASATYSDASAGTGKTIIVRYILSGSAAGNYTAPADYVYSVVAAQIVRKQLTIPSPTVITNKMVDGNTNAVISSTGNLSGLETVDASNVGLTAEAHYDNSAVGINKTITVVYTLTGSAADNYIAPLDYVISGAKVSDNITLSPLNAPTPGCENSDMELSYTILTGTPTEYTMTFNAPALAGGVKNIVYTGLPTLLSNGTLLFTIPKGMPDGSYQGTLQMKNELGVESAAYPFSFTINLSADYIIHKFDDVVLCDNSSLRFTAYQWYKDGVLVTGATDQFYCDPDGLVGSYSLKVTTKDGQSLLSCAKVLNIPLAKKISVYPSPVKVNQACTVKLIGLNEEDLDGAELSVYTMQGVRICHSTKVEKINSVNLPMAGMYTGRVTTSKGQEFLFKVIVAK